MTYLCQHCGKPLPDDLIREIIEAGFRSQRSAAGKTKTAKKSKASAENARKAASVANRGYTPEKRRVAALKRWETIRKRKEHGEKA